MKVSMLTFQFKIGISFYRISQASRNPTIIGSSQVLKHPSEFNHPSPESESLPLANDISKNPMKGLQNSVNAPHLKSSVEFEKSNFSRKENASDFIIPNSYYPLKEAQPVPAAKSVVSPPKNSSPTPLIVSSPFGFPAKECSSLSNSELTAANKCLLP